jgi:hypothetical protein
VFCGGCLVDVMGLLKTASGCCCTDTIDVHTLRAACCCSTESSSCTASAALAPLKVSHSVSSALMGIRSCSHCCLFNTDGNCCST